MRVYSRSDGCINQKDGDIEPHEITAILSVAPMSLNPVGMAHLFYHFLGAYGMDDKRNLMGIISILIGVIAMRDEDKSKKEGEDDGS